MISGFVFAEFWESMEFTPSRADETDNWGAKKGSVGGGGFERGGRGDRGVSFSRIRRVRRREWANKSYIPSERKYERQKVGFESSGGADSDNWGKKTEEEGRKFGAFDSLRESFKQFEEDFDDVKSIQISG